MGGAVMDKGLKTALIIGGVILAIVLIVPTIIGAVTGWQGYGYGGMMGPGMMGGFGMGWMSIFWIVVLGLIIWAVVAAARGTGWSGNSDSGNRSESALGILKRRYARGEINKEEFEERKKDLI